MTEFTKVGEVVKGLFDPAIEVLDYIKLSDIRELEPFSDEEYFVLVSNSETVRPVWRFCHVKHLAHYLFPIPLLPE